jgi:L-2-hydroxyglutarate oxidase LhgO
MEQIDVAVIGGGVTGLAAALAIAERGHSTCVMERHPRPGMEASTHNSGVIHAGIYYPPGHSKRAFALKAATGCIDSAMSTRCRTRDAAS